MIDLLHDSVTMMRRNLLRIQRTPHLGALLVVGPVIFVLLFNVVFGGSIVTGELEYIDFLIPGILVQTAVFDGTNTAMALAEDHQRGTIDRFRSLPMRRSAVLIGRVAADAVRAAATAVVVVAVGLLLGFRPVEGIEMVLPAVLLVVAFGHAFAWGYSVLALHVTAPESLQSASWIPVFPLVFAASTFAPVENMPSWMRPVVEHQPVTVTVDAVRALLHGGDLASPLMQSLAWTAALVAIFATWSIRKFSRG